jgi:hypothetical protein
MKFTPKDTALIAAGEYTAKVTHAEEGTSRSGFDMFTLTLTVSSDEGEAEITDYLLPDHPKAGWKLKAFCKSARLMDCYDAGELPPEVIVGSTVRVQVDIDEATEQYPAKNKITKYIQGEPPAATPRPAAKPQGVPPKQQRQPTREDPTKPPTPDEIPFSWVGFVALCLSSGLLA